MLQTVPSVFRTAMTVGIRTSRIVSTVTMSWYLRRMGSFSLREYGWRCRSLNLIWSQSGFACSPDQAWFTAFLVCRLLDLNSNIDFLFYLFFRHLPFCTVFLYASIHLLRKKRIGIALSRGFELVHIVNESSHGNLDFMRQMKQISLT